jgi:hypothetical protein
MHCKEKCAMGPVPGAFNPGRVEHSAGIPLDLHPHLRSSCAHVRCGNPEGFAKMAIRTNAVWPSKKPLDFCRIF